MLFGAGHLLRSLHITKQKITLPAPLNLTTAPKYPLRGHQLGYRPKTNSYDGWNVATWGNTSAIWPCGTNAIELIPPRSDDDAHSPHFPLPPMQMMIEMSRICAEYGLDVWMWYPALDKDYGDPKTVEFALSEWGEVFKKLPRIDHIFVPRRSRQHTAEVADEFAGSRRRICIATTQTPECGLRQGFTQDWLNEFLGIVRTEPKWLSGIVYGPQSRLTLPQMRSSSGKISDSALPGHHAFAAIAIPCSRLGFGLRVTEAREVINPRPTDQAHIFRLLQPDTNGFITYSEGCNDDVNKIIWRRRAGNRN